MGDKTGISWTDATWNPIRGCSRVSAGCVNCYAEAVARRFKGPGLAYEGLVNNLGRWNGTVRVVEDHMRDPLRWQKPRRIFVNSMSDLFHENLADAEIDRVFAVMLLSPRHTFQVLTKRADRMRRYMTDPALYDRVLRAAGEFRGERPELNQIGIDNPTTCPKPWIWLGVSVEDQKAADERIPDLIATPAKVRFLSCEPLLGPVCLTGAAIGDCDDPQCGDSTWDHYCTLGHPKLHWVIGGCESGRNARSCDVGWLRLLRDSCRVAGIPFFLKQAVDVMTLGPRGIEHTGISFGSGTRAKGQAGRASVLELPYLDGVQHAAFPTSTSETEAAPMP